MLKVVLLHVWIVAVKESEYSIQNLKGTGK